MTGKQNFSNLPEQEDQDTDYIKDKSTQNQSRKFN